MQLKLYTKKYATRILFIWVLSGLVISSKPLIGGQADQSTQFPASKLKEIEALKQLQDITFDLQAEELTLKNHQDQNFEDQIQSALINIQNTSKNYQVQFHIYRAFQLELIKNFLQSSKKYSTTLQIDPSEIDAMNSRFENGEIETGLQSLGKFEFLNVSVLRLGHGYVWKFQLPEENNRNFWTRIKKIKEVKKQIEEINFAYNQAQSLAFYFYRESYSKLAKTFEIHRYDLLSKLNRARKIIDDMSKSQNVSNLPIQYATLYNQILEQLFSYGVDVSYTSKDRDFLIQGFLLSETPEEAKAITEKLKFKITPEKIISPST